MTINKLLDRAFDIQHETQVKVVRHVRTPAGVRRFGQPIGSIIVRDRKLRNLIGLEPEYDGWDRAKGSDDKEYSIGYDDELDKWIATEGDSWDPVVEAGSEDEIWDALDSHAGGGKGKRSASGDKPKPKGKGTGNREDDYGQIKPGDTVIVDGSKATGRNAKKFDGLQGSVDSVGSKYARIYTGDGEYIQVPKNALVKNNSGLKSPGDRSTYSGLPKKGSGDGKGGFSPKKLNSADAKFLMSRNGIIGGSATNPKAVERFAEGKGSEADNIFVIDNMLRRYRAVTAAATRQQPRNKSAAERLERILGDLGIDANSIVSNRTTTYTDVARDIVKGKRSASGERPKPKNETPEQMRERIRKGMSSGDQRELYEESVSAQVDYFKYRDAGDSHAEAMKKVRGKGRLVPTGGGGGKIELAKEGRNGRLQVRMGDKKFTYVPGSGPGRGWMRGWSEDGPTISLSDAELRKQLEQWREELEKSMRRQTGKKKSDVVERALELKRMSASERRKKPCMPGTDGKFPIGNTSDLRNAIRLAGHSDEPTEKVRAWIKRRARELNAEGMIPDDWE